MHDEVKGQVPVAFTVVKVLGACYLIYLGFSQWRAGSAGTLGGDLLAAPASVYDEIFDIVTVRAEAAAEQARMHARTTTQAALRARLNPSLGR